MKTLSLGWLRLGLCHSFLWASHTSSVHSHHEDDRQVYTQTACVTLFLPYKVQASSPKKFRKVGSSTLNYVGMHVPATCIVLLPMLIMECFPGLHNHNHEDSECQLVAVCAFVNRSCRPPTPPRCIRTTRMTTKSMHRQHVRICSFGIRRRPAVPRHSGQLALVPSGLLICMRLPHVLSSCQC